MILSAFNEKIRKAFSDAALQYEMLTGLHKEIGRELSKKISQREDCSAILDIGMGTGWFTNRLANFFPEAMVVGIDSAEGMVRRAHVKQGTFRIVQGDAAQLPFKDNIFDIITSNLAYQWIADLPEAFKHCHDRITKDGLLCFTMFGFDTFQELFEAILTCRRSDENGNELVIYRLAKADQVHEALNDAGFKNIIISSERIKVRFKDMLDLIKWVKDIGANAAPKDMYIGKELLLKANDYYNSRFRDRLGVFATFEVIWVEASK